MVVGKGATAGEALTAFVAGLRQKADRELGD